MRQILSTQRESARAGEDGGALHYQHSTAERSRAIADYLDGVINAARIAPGA